MLTHRAVTNIKADPQRRIEVPDGLVPGLYLVVQPTGRKSWALRYRVGGRPAKLTLKLAEPTLAAAREAAKAELAKVHGGKDPRAARRAPAAVTLPGTVGELCDRYVEQHLEKNVRRWRAAKGEIDNHIRPHLGALALGEITRAHVREMLTAVEAVGPVAANRALQRLRALYTWAGERDLAATDPTTGIKRPTRESPVSRVLSDDELAAVWRATDALGYPAQQFVRMLILTGQRRDDVRCMTWAEVDLARGDWVIPGERFKGRRAHLIPLTRDMLAVLDTMPFKDAGGFVFSPSGGAKAYGNVTRPKRAIDKASGITGWTLHDLRRTLRTGLSRLGIRPDVAERVIGHSVGGAIGRVYDAYEFRAEKLAALEAWGAHVASLIDGRDTSNIVTLRGAV